MSLLFSRACCARLPCLSTRASAVLLNTRVYRASQHARLPCLSRPPLQPLVCVGLGVGVGVIHIHAQAIFVSNCDERDTAEDVTMIFEKYGKVCGELLGCGEVLGSGLCV
jgi:hypothetical protein